MAQAFLQRVQAVMQPPPAGPSELPRMHFIQNKDGDNRAALSSLLQRWIICKTKILPEPDNGRHSISIPAFQSQQKPAVFMVKFQHKSGDLEGGRCPECFNK